MALRETGLAHRYPSIVNGIRNGFIIAIPGISSTRTPPNRDSIIIHSEAFKRVVATEFAAGRYLGPASQTKLEREIGPFQTSPLSMVPKSHDPSAMRLVQNFSYPFTPRNDHFSINYFIDSDAFPCTWGTFTCVSLKISLLPPGSQIGIRDISEAYRIVPTHSSQWPGTVVRIPAKLFDLAARPELEGRDDVFAIDSNVAFGEASGGGAYGLVGDAFTDILRARGIGPVSKWVDDSCLFRIRREYLAEHNKVRAELAARMGERKQKGGRLWWGGASLPDGRMEEFDEDFAWPLRDLSDKSERSSDDAQYTYNFADVDSISTPLGMPWKASKDIPFSSSAPFTGLIWDLEKRTVALPDSKKAKYLATIDEWERKRAHNLQEVQSLYGKLLHACLVIPEGRAYITGLETTLGLFHDRPFLPRSSPKALRHDLEWWRERLGSSVISRPIPGPCAVVDPQAFSDASSGVGIGIVVGRGWRAWRFREGWQRDGRKIGWAEAVGFEFLVRVLVRLGLAAGHVCVYGDNEGVVKGWWNGRSRNEHINLCFRRIHRLCSSSTISVHTRYVVSCDNPADGPSRGVYPSENLLLPPIDIPLELQEFVVNFDDPRGNCRSEPLPKPARVHSTQPENVDWLAQFVDLQ
ncbi:Reverse transcriptase/ribonuclease H [Mycena kentingensis (nom. inval.)]|nr:Reverse transcriptase/ribonuclease H [Mycena kentingensis (nom. inval.)]